MAITTGITQQGLIPAQTALADKKGLIVNSWYHWLKTMSSNLQTIINGGPYIAAGSGGGVTPTITEGTLAERGAGTTGDIYFTTDTGQIFINVAGEYTELIPAFTGDVTSTVGSTELTLAVVNPVTFGSFTNISALTVNDKGLVTFVQSGPSNSNAVGVTGTIQTAGVGGGFDGDQTNLFYAKTSTTSTIQLGNTVGIGTLSLGSDGVVVSGNTTGELLLTIPSDLNINGSAGTSGEVLTSNGSGVAPTWTAIPPPALTATYVGFGSSGNTLTGSANITWTDSSSTLTLNSSGAAKIQFAGTDSIYDNGSGGMAITAANNLYLYGSAGNIYLYPGTSGTGYILEAGGDLNVAGNSGTTGQVLTSAGIGAFPTWSSPSSTTPGGSDKDVQYNNSGSFAGNGNFQWDYTNNILTLKGAASSSFGGAGLIVLDSSSNPGTIAAKFIISSNLEDGSAIDVSAAPNSATGNGGNCTLTGGNALVSGSGGGATFVGGSAIGSGNNGGGVALATGTGSSGAGSGFFQLTIGPNNALEIKGDDNAWYIGPSSNAGTLNQVLTSNGTGTAPNWANPAPVYTLATLPTAVPGFMITVSDANGGAGALCYCIGSTWLDAGTHVLVA